MIKPRQTIEARAGKAVTLLCGVALFIGAGLPYSLRGEDKIVDIPPEASAKVKGFLKKITDAQRKRLDEKMDKLIADIVRVTGLSEEGAKALKTAAAKAEDAEQSEMTEFSMKQFAREYAENAAQALAEVDQPEAIQMATSGEMPDGPNGQYTRAVDQPAWKNAFARTLTKDQLAAWEKSLKPDDSGAQKSVDTYLDGQLEQIRARTSAPILANVDNMVTTLGLPKERADALTALANKAVDASVAVSRKSTAEALLRYDKATRDRVLNNRGSFFSTVGNNEPENQKIWKEGIATLLTDEERERLKTAAASHKTRRAQALGRILVLLLDEKLAFTEDQRAAVQGLCEKLVKTQKTFFPDKGENAFYRYERQTFFKAAKAAKEAEIHPLLDDIQWQHWQEICGNPGADDQNNNARTARSNEPAKESAGPGEPEDMEAAVSDYLLTQGEAEQKQLSATLLLQVEDVARVTKLGAEATAHLRTAALGAATAAASTWLDQTETNLRGELQGATPENIQQKIAGMGRYSFSRPDKEENPIWKAAVGTELDAEQQKAWQGERDRREQYSAGAIAQFVEAELDRKIALTLKQWEQLGAVLAQTVQDYTPEIRSNFSYYTYPWYLQSYTLYVPLHAVPEKDLKAILSPAQFASWTGSQECTYSGNYWENIRSNHERRVKQKEEGKKDE